MERDGVIVAELVAYIHQSQGRPGIDSGTGWKQNVRLTFSDAAVLTNCESFPDTILDGTLELGDATFENGFSVPHGFTGPCCMRIELANDRQLVISGGEFSAALIGQPNFIENFQP